MRAKNVYWRQVERGVNSSKNQWYHTQVQPVSQALSSVPFVTDFFAAAKETCVNPPMFSAMVSRRPFREMRNNLILLLGFWFWRVFPAFLLSMFSFFFWPRIIFFFFSRVTVRRHTTAVTLTTNCDRCRYSHHCVFSLRHTHTYIHTPVLSMQCTPVCKPVDILFFSFRCLSPQSIVQSKSLLKKESITAFFPVTYVQILLVCPFVNPIGLLTGDGASVHGGRGVLAVLGTAFFSFLAAAAALPHHGGALPQRVRP